MKSIKINSKTVLSVFLLVFPILPYYFSILGVSGINLLAVLFIALTFMIKHVKPMPSKSTAFGIFLALWIIGQSISLLFHGSITPFINLVLTTVGVWYGMYLLIDKKQKFFLAIKTLIYSGGLVSIFGVIESLTGFNVFSLLNTTGAILNYNPKRFGITRIISFSSHAIIYGVFLMFAMSLLLYYFQFCKSTREKNMLKIIYILMWVNILFTLSRSSIICVAISQLLIVFFSGKTELIKVICKVSLFLFLLILLIGIISPKLLDSLKNVWYMILALFDDKYRSIISASFGSDNLIGIGNRVDLYEWVFEKMPGNWVFGYGLNNQFTHQFTTTNGVYTWQSTKSGIEVQYLNTIYYYGLIAAIPEIIIYVKMLIESFMKRHKANWEEKIGFNAVVFSVFSSYFLALFAVNRSSESRVFYIFIGLFIVYNLRKSSFVLEDNNNA